MTDIHTLALEAGLLVEHEEGSGITYWTEGNSDEPLEALRALIKKESAEKIFNWLMTSSFERWHEEDFAAFLHGDEEQPEKEDLIKEIEFFLG